MSSSFAADLSSTQYRDEPDDFDYRPMSMMAVLAFVLSLLSLGLMFIWFTLPIAVVSALLGLLAITRIRRSMGEFGGMKLALTGLVFSIAALAGGVGYQVYAYQTEVPPDHQRISFTKDISQKGFVTYQAQQGPHPDIMALDGQKIFLKGFMYPTGQISDLKSFLLVKDTDQCCFGGKPKLWDMIGVYMQGGHLANYYSGRVSVAGTFRLNREYKGESELEPVFLLDGIQVQPSHSDFDPLAPAEIKRDPSQTASATTPAIDAAARARDGEAAPADQPSADSSKTDQPKADATKTDQPKADATKTEQPKADSSKTEQTPAGDAPAQTPPAEVKPVEKLPEAAS